MFDAANILYLAHYAPDQTGKSAPYDNVHKVYAEYHQKIYDILATHCPHVTSANTPEIILQLPKEINYIFSLYNRMPFRNSEIFISSLAEYHKTAYLGAPPNIRALAEDKHLAKMMAKYAGVPTAKWQVYSVGDYLSSPSFSGPFFIKPRFGAASKYIDESSICDTWEGAIKKIDQLFQNNQDVIVEEFIDGIYYTSPVLNNFGDNIFLPCIEEISVLKGNIATYYQKRKIEGGLYRHIIMDKKLDSKIKNCSKQMFSLIQPLDYTRFDYIVGKQDGIPYFLEFNVCCNLGEHSTISQAASSLGYSYENLILNILASSLYRNHISDDTSYHF